MRVDIKDAMKDIEKLASARATRIEATKTIQTPNDATTSLSTVPSVTNLRKRVRSIIDKLKAQHKRQGLQSYKTLPDSFRVSNNNTVTDMNTQKSNIKVAALESIQVSSSEGELVELINNILS